MGTTLSLAAVEDNADEFLPRGDPYHNRTCLVITKKKYEEMPLVLSELRDLLRLDLSDNLIEKIPEWISLLSKLETFQMCKNEIKALPNEISNLTNLTFLGLWDNQLSNIQGRISYLTALKTLSVSDNRIVLLPNGISCLTNLTNIRADKNRLSTIPNGLSCLTALKLMSISCNEITSLPTGISLLTNLTNLSMELNQIHHIPQGISELKELKYFAANENQLTVLPGCISLLTNLTNFSVGGNQISSIPEGISCIVELRYFDLSENHINMLPNELSRLTNLTTLNIDGNQITTIPAGLFCLRELVEFSLCDNQISLLPNDISRLNKLTYMRIDQNKLGILPGGLFCLNKLRCFSVGNNLLISLPSEISRLTNLTCLRINGNRISVLPNGLSRLPKLNVLILFQNQLSIIPGWVSALSHLSILSVWDNPMTELPPEIALLRKLKMLALENNQGEASITRAPKGISKLPCWKNNTKPGPMKDAIWMRTYAEALRRLTLYETVQDVTNPPEALKLEGKITSEKSRYSEETSTIEESPKARRNRNLKESRLSKSSQKFEDSPLSEETPGIGLIAEIEGHTIAEITENVEDTLKIEESTKPKRNRSHKESRRSKDTSKIEESFQSEQTPGVRHTEETAEDSVRTNEVAGDSLIAREVHSYGELAPFPLGENVAQYIQTLKTFHPDTSKEDHVPFAEGEVFQVLITSSSDDFKVSYKDGSFIIQREHAKDLGLGNCGNVSLKDQDKRREKLSNNYIVVNQAERPVSLAGNSYSHGEQESVVTEAETSICLSGGLCGICFGQYNNPCFLPCQHTFCSGCIRTAISSSKEEPPFKCTFCGELAYVDEYTVGELRLFDYQEEYPESEGASPETTKSLENTQVLRCKARNCQKDATHFCVACGERGVFCQAHGEMHMEVLDESHDVKQLEIGALSSAKKAENCNIHKSNPIAFFCPLCPESPFKCVECVLEDEGHQKRRVPLNQEGFDVNAIITTKIQELCAAESKLSPNIQSVEQKIKEITDQYKQKTIELEEFVKEMENLILQFKKEANKELDTINQSALVPLQESHERLSSEIHRIHIAKQTLSKVLEKPEEERSFIKMGNALRFANQVLYSKYDTPIHIAPISIVSQMPRSILDGLKKLNDILVYGLSTASIQPRTGSHESRGHHNSQDRRGAQPYKKITWSIGLPSNISSTPKATIDSFSGESKIECPWAVCVHPQSGNVYVTDEDLQKVYVYDKNLSHISSHHTGLIIPKLQHGPRGIAISNNGLIAIADCEGHSVKLFTNELTHIRTIGGKKGKEYGQFNRPYSVAFDSKGNFYVADSGNLRVQKFNEKGGFVSVIGDGVGKRIGKDVAAGGTINSLVNGVCVNEEDKLLVLCANSDKVRMFSKEGVFEGDIKLESQTSIEAWSHIFRASRGVFGVCENKTGAIVFYDYKGAVQHRFLLDGCLGACFGLDGTFYATSLSFRMVFAFPAASK